MRPPTLLRLVRARLGHLRFALLLGCFAPSAAAQWASTPFDGVVVGWSSELPLLRAAHDGGIWVLQRQPLQQLNLQRLDPAGHNVPPFGLFGLTVSNIAWGFGTPDISIAPDGSALIAFIAWTGAREGRVQRVSPSGVKEWDQAGLVPVGGQGDPFFARIDATADGGAVVGWSKNGELQLQRLDVSGQVLWSVVLGAPTGSFPAILTDLELVDGDVVCALVDTSAGAGAFTTLELRRFGPNGSPRWGGSALAIHSTILSVPDGPHLQADGSGGVVASWFSRTVPFDQYFVQRIDAGGNALWGPNGLGLGAPVAGTSQAGLSVDVDEATGDAYATWLDTNTATGQRQVLAQRVDESGQERWGPGGLLLDSGSSTNTTDVVALFDAATRRARFAWGSGNQVVGQDLTPQGASAGSPFLVRDSTTTTFDAIGVLLGVELAGRRPASAYTWQDNSRYLAQRVDENGQLGGPVEVGAVTCRAITNSTGAPADLTAIGSTITARNDIDVQASELPPGAPVVFLAGTDDALAPAAGGGQGTLCLGGAITRLDGPGQVGPASAQGERSIPLDLTLLPAATAGSSLRFQAWFRDQNPAPTSNLTSGLRIDFL